MSFKKKRKKLVKRLINKGILEDEKVIEAMKKVPRENFLPEGAKSKAYIDSPLSIGSGQTISAPHMNAMMCENLNLEEGDKVLEIGTGSGYHAALCAEIVAPDDSDNQGHIYTIERHKSLADSARENLEEANYGDRVTVIHGDGTLGYEKKAPYDKILVTAASPKKIPRPLKKQLKDEGKLCIPAGSKKYSQSLYIIKRVGNEFESKRLTGVRFVPLVGKHGFED
ncbi:MAG: protein-L-isoaspartate(D-aspartate) O-methyltransferase [Promethearchaeia archaeon]